MYGKYKLSWTMAIFHTKMCNPKNWAKFRKKYEKNFIINNKIDNHNKMTMWAFDKERINWIKKNLPENCHVKFLQITDKQFGDMEIFYKGANNVHR